MYSSQAFLWMVPEAEFLAAEPRADLQKGASGVLLSIFNCGSRMGARRLNQKSWHAALGMAGGN